MKLIKLLLIPLFVFSLLTSAYAFTPPTSEYDVDGNTTLLSHFNGSDGATSYTAETGQAFTFVGTAQLDTAYYKWTSSLLLDGNSDYVTLPDNATWYLGSGDFTIDFWARFPALPETDGEYYFPNQYASDVDNDRSWAIYFTLSGGDYRVVFQYSINGSSNITAFSKIVDVSVDTWYHFAFVRDGADLDFYLGGDKQGDAYNISTDSIYDSSRVLAIGVRSGDGTGPLNGWIEEVRISNVARDWALPSAPSGQIVGGYW